MRFIVTVLTIAPPLLVASASAYTSNVRETTRATSCQHKQQLDRRAFVTASSASAFAIVGSQVPPSASAAADTGTTAVKVKVTPVAHTFVASADKGIKPLRENDATRFFANAKIVVPFYGGSDPSKVDEAFAEILNLTTKRKAEKGPGVTQGGVIYGEIVGQKVAPSASAANKVAVKDASSSSVASAVSALPADGDVLILSPIQSKGMAGDGKVVADIAKAANLEAGSRGGQVLGLLIDGPQSFLLSGGGFALQPILWYSI
mmetsp:Transcript_18154/g.51963  ORF Transcript_18154/g.51963 Transcript_18154/m.51963 type:complete len:261 (-) Transcript_18154:100-882(-)